MRVLAKNVTDSLVAKSSRRFVTVKSPTNPACDEEMLVRMTRITGKRTATITTIPTAAISAFGMDSEARTFGIDSEARVAGRRAGCTPFARSTLVAFFCRRVGVTRIAGILLAWGVALVRFRVSSDAQPSEIKMSALQAPFGVRYDPRAPEPRTRLKAGERYGQTKPVGLFVDRGCHLLGSVAYTYSLSKPEGDLDHLRSCLV